MADAYETKLWGGRFKAEEDTLLSDILFRLSNYIDTKVDASVNQSGIWSKVGVVIKHNETQSYIGIAIRVKNPHK